MDTDSFGLPIKDDFDVFHNAHWVAFPRWLSGEVAFVWDGKNRLTEWWTDGGGKYAARAVVTGVKTLDDCQRVQKAYHVGLGDDEPGVDVEVVGAGFKYRSLIVPAEREAALATANA